MRMARRILKGFPAGNLCLSFPLSHYQAFWLLIGLQSRAHRFKHMLKRLQNVASTNMLFCKPVFSLLDVFFVYRSRVMFARGFHFRGWLPPPRRPQGCSARELFGARGADVLLCFVDPRCSPVGGFRLFQHVLQPRTLKYQYANPVATSGFNFPCA